MKHFLLTKVVLRGVVAMLIALASSAHAQEPAPQVDGIAAVIAQERDAQIHAGADDTETAQPMHLAMSGGDKSASGTALKATSPNAITVESNPAVADFDFCTRKSRFRKPSRKPADFDRSTTYRVKPGDQLEISIWKEPDMRREMLVLPDGTISYPLAGHVQVVGMTPKEIEDVLTRRLTRYFQNPFINVIVKRTTGNQIYVLGEVRNPGAFTINQPIDVMQALSLAGGLSEFADKGEIIVLRRTDNGKQDVISFKYSSVQRGRNLGTNVTLVSGDTVVVPERGLF